MRTCKRGSIPVDKEKVLSLTAAVTGTHFLEIDTGGGSALITTDNPHVSEMATEATPLSLFCSPVTRWFYIPQAARSFALRAVDGGRSEPARFQVISPTGRVALDRSGNWLKDMVTEIRPLRDERGALWQLRCTPQQDVQFWLEGDACGLLGRTPGQTLKW